MTVPVLSTDIDEQNHVNNTVYLRWVQEVATMHWRTVASTDAQENIGWVVLRHEIDYKAAACLGDEVVLRTWVGKATRLTLIGADRFGDDNCDWLQVAHPSAGQSGRKEDTMGHSEFDPASCGKDAYSWNAPC